GGRTQNYNGKVAINVGGHLPCVGLRCSHRQAAPFCFLDAHPSPPSSYSRVPCIGKAIPWVPWVMKEQDVRHRIESFLKRTARDMIIPASVGLGLALAGCSDV